LPPGAQRTDDAVVDVLYSVLAGPSDLGARIRRYNLAYADATQVARSMDFDDVVESVERHLSLFVAEFARKRVFVHAGVVGWNGRAILIPGETMSGKSTLVAALMRAGATYYSDEFAVIGPGGRVYPYPRPLQLRREGRRSHRIAPAAVGRTPLRVGLVLVTRYRGGAAFRPRVMSPGQAMLALLRNTVSAQHNPGQALRILAKSLAGARCVQGSRSEAEITVRQLLSRQLMPPALSRREGLARLSA
jgi:hypothetical protein